MNAEPDGVRGKRKRRPQEEPAPKKPRHKKTRTERGLDDLRASTRRARKERQSDQERERQLRGGKSTSSAAPAAAEGQTAAKQGAKRMKLVDEKGRHAEVEVRGPTLFGLQKQEQDAVAAVSRDWEAAYQGGLRSPGFDPAVDGAAMHGAHLLKLNVQARLAALKKHLGERDYELIVAYAVNGMTVSEFSKATGIQKSIVSSDLRRAIRQTAAFYSPGSAALAALRERDKLWKTAHEVFAQMEAEGPPSKELLESLANNQEAVERSLERQHERARAKRVAEKPNVAAASIAAIESWALLERATVQEFALRAIGNERGIVAYGLRADGAEISTTILVSGPYIAAAIDAQLLMAAEAKGWPERAPTTAPSAQFDRRVTAQA